MIFIKESFQVSHKSKFMPENDWSKSNFWLSAIQLDGIEPNYLIDELERENIESRPVWKPMHMQPIFEKYDFIGTNIAQELFETGVCLPSDTKMTDADLYRVTNTIKRAIKNAK